MLSFDNYQAQATATAIYPGQGSFTGLAYAVLGLNGEAGETGEAVKKLWRVNGQMNEEVRGKIIKELGDTLWYAAQVATEIGVSLGDVAQINLDKLARRRAEGTIAGEGSDR